MPTKSLSWRKLDQLTGRDQTSHKKVAINECTFRVRTLVFSVKLQASRYPFSTGTIKVPIRVPQNLLVPYSSSAPSRALFSRLLFWYAELGLCWVVRWELMLPGRPLTRVPQWGQVHFPSGSGVRLMLLNSLARWGPAVRGRGWEGRGARFAAGIDGSAAATVAGAGKTGSGGAWG